MKRKAVSLSSSERKDSMSIDHITDEVLRGIKSHLDKNEKFDDIHVMSYLTIQKALVTKGKNTHNHCDIRIIDSLHVSLFLSKARNNDTSSLSFSNDDDNEDEEDIQQDLKRLKTTNITKLKKKQKMKQQKVNQAKRHYEKLLSYFSKTENNDDNYIVLIPLNGAGHWSLLVYCAFIKNWYIIDSIKQYHSTTTKEFLTLFFKFDINETKKHGFMNTKVDEINNHDNQLSDWECGQFLVVYAGLFLRYLSDLKRRDTSVLLEKIAEVANTPGLRLAVLTKVLDLFKTL